MALPIVFALYLRECQDSRRVGLVVARDDCSCSDESRVHCLLCSLHTWSKNC